MAVRIGHASGGDTGARGGKAGDQTGREVKVSNWYSSSWDFVARAKDPEVAAAMNENIGYDQGEYPAMSSMNCSGPFLKPKKSLSRF